MRDGLSEVQVLKLLIRSDHAYDQRLSLEALCRGPVGTLTSSTPYCIDRDKCSWKPTSLKS